MNYTTPQALIDFAGLPANIADRSINIVPEPTLTAVAAIGIVSLPLPRSRKRGPAREDRSLA